MQDRSKGSSRAGVYYVYDRVTKYRLRQVYHRRADAQAVVTRMNRRSK